MNDGTPIIIKKKKSHGGHAHHGGSWKVAYADFVTAMMAFFMVMWIMGLSDSTRAQICGYFNDPLGFNKSMPKSKNVLAIPSGPPQSGLSHGSGAEAVKEEVGAMKKIQKDLDNAIENGSVDLKQIAKQVELTVTQEGLQIELVESTGAVFFESGSAAVRPIAAQLLAKITPIIAKTGRRLMVEGHTDAMKYPSSTYNNWDLSTDRANAIRRLLEANGIDDKQLIQIRGYAATKLKKPEAPFHFSNRRVTLLLPFKNLSEPQFDMPKEAFEHDRQGIFRKPLDVIPDKPDVTANPPRFW